MTAPQGQIGLYQIRSQICVIRVPEGEEKEERGEKLPEEIMTKNFPNVLNNPNLHIQEAQQTLRRKNAMRYTNRHIIVKMLKVNYKEKNLESSKRKVTSHLQMIRLTVDFSAQIIKSRKQNNIFKLLKEKKLPTKSPLSSKATFQT